PKGDPPTQKILWGTRHQGHQEGLILGNETTALPATAPATPEKQAGEEALSGTGVASSKSPAYSAGSPRNDSGNGKVGTLAWEALAGISVINQIKTKIKKGEKPAWWEAILLTGHTLGRAVIWLAKHAYKLVRPLLKFIGRLFLDALKSIAGFFGQTFYGIAKVVMIIVLLLGVGWFGWDIYKHGIYHPLNLIESKVQHLVFRPEPPTPKADSSAPKPQVEGQALSVPISPKQEMGAPKELTQSTLGSQPVASTQTQPKPVTWPVASAKAQVQSTPTAHKDVVGQAVGSVGGDVAVDVAKKLFGL
ncbi:MAG TPA: hypothetical protein VIJ93_07605, partial [bacterium]